MSRHFNRSITCPECNKESEFLIWDSINTTLDPEMYDAVRDGSAFVFKCPHCGHEANVDYGFLYHQMSDKIMIHYAVSDENAAEILDMFSREADPENVVDSMVHDLMHDNYLIRIVRSRNQLLEKLAIFDAGLDDRIIEIIKLFFLVQLQKENEEVNVEDILMFTAEDGSHVLQFMAGGRGFATAVISDEMYADIQDNFGKNLPGLREGEIVIDRNWALDYLR